MHTRVARSSLSRACCPAAPRSACQPPKPGRHWLRSGRGTAQENAQAGRRRTGRRPEAHLPAQEGGRQKLPEKLAATSRTAGPGLTCTESAPCGAARLLAEVGDITRCPHKARFASWNGTAPIDASSGEQIRRGLSRADNRQISRALHIMAVVQLRNPTEGRTTTAAKSPRARSGGSHARAETADIRHRLH
jgi:transposase